ncbi:uncharacterized protein LOC132205834 [Neocloeon triangulifer]|uniref:uncharacterized protein LOC132205834 n=1 Tax=Neocloeon triangulifer TaxID=2078957 RepID=UPI00286ED386|nr:uncharacterized protein LOC132205834 [Neocloeon triangulifer]
MDEAASLSGLEGQDWAKWIRRLGRDRPEDDLNGVDSPDAGDAKPTAHCKRLPFKDHLLFGHCPEVDPFVAAVCEHCNAIVKIPFLQQHIALRHNGMLKKYKTIEETKPVLPPKQLSPPTSVKPPAVAAPKVPLLPVMGKQSILVAAAARFAEAPLSPPVPPPQVVEVVKVEKSRKRGRANKASADAPEKRRRVETAGGYNPDIHCGVWNEQTKTNCLRALTCRIHSLVLKRAVPMRTRLFDDLLAQHKLQHKVKKVSSNHLDEDGDVVVEEEESIPEAPSSTACRPNGLTITGSFAKAEISLEEFPIAPSEFLPLSFPRLSASAEVTKKPLLGDYLIPHKQQPPDRWSVDSSTDCRPPAPKPLMVCNTSNLRKFGGYLGVQRGLQVLRHKFQCLVYAKENNNEEIKFDYLGFPPASVNLMPPIKQQHPEASDNLVKRKRIRRRAVVARRLRLGKVKYRLKLVRHRKHKNHRISPKKQQQLPQQQVLVNTKKRKAGSFKENSSLNGTKPGESLLMANRTAVGLLSSRPHSALGDAAAAHPSTASTAIGSQMEADTLRANKSKGTLIRLSDLAEPKNHKKSNFSGSQTMVTVQQVPRVLSTQLISMPGESSSLKFLPPHSKTALFSFSKKDHEKT